eukprot:1264984-Alexandrium_andersonii.AAC.1
MLVPPTAVRRSAECSAMTAVIEGLSAASRRPLWPPSTGWQFSAQEDCRRSLLRWEPLRADPWVPGSYRKKRLGWRKCS